MSKDYQADITAWLDSAGRFPVLPAAKINIIAKEIQALPEGSVKRKKLVNKIVKHNLRLVVRFAKSFMNSKSHNKWGSAETVDYLQVGSMGLIRAAEKFDPSRGYTFSTYANYWIRNAIGRYNLKTMSPVHVSEFASRQLIFYRRNGYLNNKHDGKQIDISKVELMLRQAQAAYSCVSLDRPAGDSGVTLLEYIEDTNRLNDVDNISVSIQDSLREAGVSDLGRTILVDIFMKNKTMEQISTETGVAIADIKIEKKTAIEMAKSCPEAF